MVLTETVNERQAAVIKLELLAAFKAAGIPVVDAQFEAFQASLGEGVAISVWDSTRRKHGFNSDWTKLDGSENRVCTPEESMLQPAVSRRLEDPSLSPMGC